MLKLIKDLFLLLTPSQRRRFYKLQTLVILMALTEVVGVASIAPFMALVGDLSLLEKDNLLAKVYLSSGLQNPYDFVFWVGVCVLSTLALSATLAMITTWSLAMFAARVGTENADRLYAHYLNQNWLFHAGESSSKLVKQIANEAVRVTDLIILPLIIMNSKIVLVVFLMLTVVIINPSVALFSFLFLSVSYVFIYSLVKKRLQNNGKSLSDVATLRFKLMNEAFGGIKDVLLLNRQSDFIARFNKSGKEFADARGNNHVLWQVPRYFMELLAFGGMIGLVLYLIRSHDGDLGAVLPLLAVYSLAGVKVLPAFQQIYASMGQIRGNIAAFEAIREDLLGSQVSSQRVAKTGSKFNLKLPPRKYISLVNISFSYPGKSESAVKDLSMTIPANKLIGIVGPSGSGKSTTIDIILGLIQPTVGKLTIDGVLIEEENRQHWQNSIGFVAQSIFLSEGSIAENVAFGIPRMEIDIDQVKTALNLAHLDDLVSSLEQGIHTKVGERGVQLSGGQRQRIGIARALYQDAAVLVFDEATSALDGITEKVIMDAIHDFSDLKTIIMIAHRLKTVQQCDHIFFIDQGAVVDQGTYDELIIKNGYFREMASHA